jgi:hypothetical protein
MYVHGCYIYIVLSTFFLFERMRLINLITFNWSDRAQLQFWKALTWARGKVGDRFYLAHNKKSRSLFRQHTNLLALHLDPSLFLLILSLRGLAIMLLQLLRLQSNKLLKCKMQQKIVARLKQSRQFTATINLVARIASSWSSTNKLASITRSFCLSVELGTFSCVSMLTCTLN